ncbi:Na+/H+ antiporter family protein [Kingella negevensis]|uniref:Na+/H+ antiporter family protein n=1 Tax=Kingella negevensis TaxID=1522312 RepID=A0A238HIA6_9NEIS|nr:Na+/H+ antiporter family protein [Kingella negevensis]MDK4679659.1 Na+/H+ antiporter family protein [Kingella negevensis]MDK4682622.1 Na+/H+ antiporter family protein [Kingella negevensis]MDK4684165.1 Na+/H+ antiporter family protein [Kingella negevensis]MDK4690819.1 Na+/H+ antiporter family protein [Kingella negevensis]MDK4694034.1 Na+/H+ antiporter family protein [Kingella negevensis]
MNAVMIGVIVMLVLSVSRVHVVLSLVIGAFAGGLSAGLPLTDIVDAAGTVTQKGVMSHFQSGLQNGAGIALSYAMLGAFAMAISHSGLPHQVAGAVIRKIDAQGRKDVIPSGVNAVKWSLLLGVLAMGIMSQNIVPIHIAFIPMIVPPLLMVFNRLQIDRRLLACVMTFGLTTTYMFLPYGFGAIFLNEILLANIAKAGLDVKNINIMQAMAIPALGMLTGLLLAFVHYRKPRIYQDRQVDTDNETSAAKTPEVSTYRSVVAGVAILACFAIQLIYRDALMLGALLGFSVFMMLGVVRRSDADSVFNKGIQMMAMVGFIMIAAQGFAEVMKATNQIQPLVEASASMFAGSKAAAAFAMLMVGLLVTMGIGSSFSTLPIITAIYVPLCVGLGFSPLATVAIIGTAGALGDAGSPASDSTLGPTMGLNVDGQHDHMRDSVIPTFLHYNIPLFIAGLIASLVL